MRHASGEPQGTDRDGHAAAGSSEDGELGGVRETGASVTVEALLEGEESVRRALDAVGSTWAMLTLTSLANGNRRYSEIKRSVASISDRMLSQTLRGFVRDGLVVRTVHRTVPAHVEYELTDTGRQVWASLADLISTLMRLAPDVARARAAFESEEQAAGGDRRNPRADPGPAGRSAD